MRTGFSAHSLIETVTVIDFETANHSFTSACSIGIAVIKGTEIVDRQYYLIQPPQNYYDLRTFAPCGIA